MGIPCHEKHRSSVSVLLLIASRRADWHRTDVKKMFSWGLCGWLLPRVGVAVCQSAPALMLSKVNCALVHGSQCACAPLASGWPQTLILSSTTTRTTVCQPHQHQPYPANRFSFPGFRCVSNLDWVVPELCVSLHHTSYICPGLLPPCTGVKAGRLHVLIIRPVPKVPTNEANLWQKETGSCLTIIVLADWYQHRSSPEYTFFFLFDTRHCRHTFPGHSRATSMAVISNFTTLTDCTNDAICAW